MVAVRAAEEEERQRDELLKKQGSGSSGMQGFHRRLLDDMEKKHEATVVATHRPVTTMTKPPDFTPISDLELAKKARDGGKKVELNNENQIVDKRDLLVAGLNVSALKTRRLGEPSTEGNSREDRDIESAADQRKVNKRRVREMRQQIESEDQDLLKRRKEKSDHEATQRIVAKRNNEDAVQTSKCTRRLFAKKATKINGGEAKLS